MGKNTFTVTITEKTSWTTEVEATSKEEAEEIKEKLEAVGASAAIK